jgi:hypothetical protein
VLKLVGSQADLLGLFQDTSLELHSFVQNFIHQLFQPVDFNEQLDIRVIGSLFGLNESPNHFIEIVKDVQKILDFLSLKVNSDHFDQRVFDLVHNFLLFFLLSASQKIFQNLKEILLDLQNDHFVYHGDYLLKDLICDLLREFLVELLENLL